MATRYLLGPSGGLIGFMDQQGKQLYDRSGLLLARLDPARKYFYRPDGSFYGYVSGVARNYLYAPAGEVLGRFQPGFLDLH